MHINLCYYISYTSGQFLNFQGFWLCFLGRGGQGDSSAHKVIPVQHEALNPIPSAHVKSQTLGHMLVSQHWGGGVRRSLEFIGQDILAKNMIPRFQ